MALVDHKTGEFLEVNDAVLSSTGYTKDEFMKLSYWDITPIEYEEQEKAQIELLNKTGSFGPNVKEYIRKDGTRFPISISGALFTEINGEQVVWGIIEDITERTKAEKTIKEQNEELIALNAAKDKFLTILAHDLKTPFTSLLGLLELVLRNYDRLNKDQLLEYIHMMDSVTTNTYSMLDDILLWIKAESNKIEFEPEPLTISELYNAIIDTFDPIAKTKQISIQRDLTELLPIIADKQMIKTILRNLISNAIKFTQPRGSINIQSKILDNKLVTSVTDSGVGIDPMHLKNIFNVSNNYSTPGTADEKGTGLGLLICKEFVEKHGGKIHVSSKPEKGSSFIFELPISA
ncbi:MAG: PAS domain S-box protein [Balneolaceae bacterium]|nr:PAS domain S-box protein [Balneolaceae bacterium]